MKHNENLKTWLSQQQQLILWPSYERETSDNIHCTNTKEILINIMWIMPYCISPLASPPLKIIYCTIIMGWQTLTTIAPQQLYYGVLRLGTRVPAYFCLQNASMQANKQSSAIYFHLQRMVNWYTLVFITRVQSAWLKQSEDFQTLGQQSERELQSMYTETWI